MKRRNCDKHSEYSGSQTRFKAITTAKRDAAQRCRPASARHCGSGRNKTVRAVAEPHDAPPVQLSCAALYATASFAEASRSAPPGSCALPHRTDGDQDGQIFWTGSAAFARHPNWRDAQGVHRCIESRSRPASSTQDRRRAMMTFAALLSSPRSWLSRSSTPCFRGRDE